MKHVLFLFLLIAPLATYAQQMVEPVESAPVEEVPVYRTVEQMPAFPGGQDSLTKFLAANLKYPEGKKEVSGTVYVSFIVNENGQIYQPVVVRGIQGHPEFDKEVLRVMALMPLWTPGKEKGKAVPVQMTLPVKFTTNK